MKNVLGWGLGPAWGLAALWGIGWSVFSRRASALARLTALWASAPFLFYAMQFASTGRYYTPLLPALAVVAASSLAGRKRLLAAVIVVTALWALAFTTIYRRPHTRIEASRAAVVGARDMALAELRRSIGLPAGEFDRVPVPRYAGDLAWDSRGVHVRGLELTGERTAPAYARRPQLSAG